MARLWFSGFEENDATTLEGQFKSSTAPTISTTTVRTGTYSMNAVMTNASVRALGFATSASAVASNLYSRGYLNIATLPVNANSIIGLNNSASFGFSSTHAHIKLSATGTLQLFNGTVQIGSDSSVLNLNQFYRVELHYNNVPASGSQVLEAMIDGVSFASASNLTLQLGNVMAVGWGANLGVIAATVTGSWFWDDIAVNDTTGSFQTSWPGSGRIIALRPNAAGDNTQWTPLASTNFSQVQEVTSDGDTSYVSSKTAAQLDDYNIDNSGIGASDTVNVVAVFVRARGETGTPFSTFKVRVKASSGGTTLESSVITPTGISYFTNAVAVPNIPPLVTYQDPTGANWLQSTLDTAQIGIDLTASATNKVRVSTIWMLVDYTPASVGPTNIKYITYRPPFLA